MARLLADRSSKGPARSEATILAPAIATWVAISLAGLVPLLIVATTPAPRFAGWGPAAILIVAGLRFAWIVGVGQQRLAEMAFWLFTYVFLGLAPFVQYRTGETPATTPGVDFRLNDSTVVVVLVGVAFVCVGMAARTYRTKSTEMAAPRPTVSPTEARVYAFTFCAFLVTSYYVASVGPAALFTSREGLVRSQAALWPDPALRIVIIAASTMPLMVAVVALLKLRRNRGEKPKTEATAVLVIALAALFLTVNPITSPRYVFGTVLLAVLTAAGMSATKRRFRVVALTALAGIVIIFPVADLFRYSDSTHVKSSNVFESLTSPDFDAFSQINNSVRYVERHGVNYGEQSLGVALFWVPRSVWPEKPMGTGPLLAESQGYSVSNLSAPLWAEFYVDGAWLALAIGMFGTGWLIRRGDERAITALKREAVPGVLACIMPFYLIILLRGDLMQAMSYLLVILLACWAVRSRTSSPAQHQRA